MQMPTAYRWDLLPEIVADIEHGRGDRKPALFAELLDALDDGEGNDVSLYKLRCAQFMSACMRGARRGGAPSDVLLAEHLLALRKLAGLTTKGRIRRFFRAYGLHLASQVRPITRTSNERAVLGIIAD